MNLIHLWSFNFQPHIARLFGKKDNSSNIMPMQYKDVEKLLETEKSRCRRLQDQLSQARAEVVALQRESKPIFKRFLIICEVSR